MHSSQICNDCDDEDPCWSQYPDDHPWWDEIPEGETRSRREKWNTGRPGDPLQT